MYFEIDFLLRELSEIDIRDMSHLNVFPEKSLNIYALSSHTTAEVYLEPFQTYMVEIFCGKN